MKHKTNKKKLFPPALFFCTLFISILISCSQPTVKTDFSTISLKIAGTSDYPVNLSWTLHDQNGSATEIFNYDYSNPYVVSNIIVPDTFSELSYRLFSDNLEIKINTDDINLIYETGFIKYLELSGISEALLDTIQIGDVIVNMDTSSDAGPPGVKYIIRGLNKFSFPVIAVSIIDNSKVFTEGTVNGNGDWYVISPHKANLTAWFERDGQFIGEYKSASTDYENINLEYGFLYQ